MSTSQISSVQTGDLGIARIVLSHDGFLDGHVGLDADEVFGETAPSEPGTVSIHLNGEVVDGLLAARGWCRSSDGRWHAPDGDSAHWGRDEALTLALTAEAC